MERQPCVYILSNVARTVLYVGVTTNLEKRIWEHSQGFVGGFSSQYRTFDLLYFELCSDIRVAIQREKSIKRWRRAWKNALISSMNPKWQDLSAQLN